jgi:hypothetical protein
MMYSEYTNIDGDINTTTPWYLDPYQDYGDNVGAATEYRKSFTKIREIPSINGDTSAYWEGETYLKTKLMTENTFVTEYEFIASSLVVMIDGVPVQSGAIEITGADTFVLNSGTLSDGYMYVDYNPSDVNYCVGNHVAEIDAARLRATHYNGTIMANDIIRCRQAVNAMQVQSETVPSGWIGGADNNQTSRSTGIIYGQTHIYGVHITELQNAILDLADHLTSISSETMVAPTFTTVGTLENYNVQWIEEIRVAINFLEQYLINIFTA